MNMTTTTMPARMTSGSDFAVLASRITGEGLMRRRPAYYAARLSVVALMLLGGWAAFFVIGSSSRPLVSAALLAGSPTPGRPRAPGLSHRPAFPPPRPPGNPGRTAGYP